MIPFSQIAISLVLGFQRIFVLEVSKIEKEKEIESDLRDRERPSISRFVRRFGEIGIRIQVW